MLCLFSSLVREVTPGWHFMPYFELIKCLHPHPKPAAFTEAGELSWHGGRSEMVWGISQTYSSSVLGPGLSVLQQCPRQILPKGLSMGLPMARGWCPGRHKGQEAVFTLAFRKVKRFCPVWERLNLVWRRFWVPPSCDNSQECP